MDIQICNVKCKKISTSACQLLFIVQYDIKRRKQIINPMQSNSGICENRNEANFLEGL